MSADFGLFVLRVVLGVVVAAHPFRWGQRFRDILRQERPDLDGMELMTYNMDADCRRRAAEVFAERTFAGLGSSDAHEPARLGCCYTDFPVPIRDSADLIQANRGRHGVACEIAA